MKGRTIVTDKQKLGKKGGEKRIDKQWIGEEGRKECDKNSWWGLTNVVKIIEKGMFVLIEVLKEKWERQWSWKKNVCWGRKGRTKISFEEKEKTKGGEKWTMEHWRNNKMAEIYTFIERTGERKGKERKTYWERNRCWQEQKRKLNGLKDNL